MSTIELVPYEKIRSISGTKHLLIGNGHSIACDPRFQYPSLYEKAKEAGLPGRAQKTFEYLGTNNFEGVLRLLLDGEWLARNYEFIDANNTAIAEDMAIIKNVLVQTIAKSHFEDHTEVGAAKLEAGRAFLGSYKNVFTTNYDLLAYWTNVLPDLGSGKPIYQDGFEHDPDDTDTVMFSPSVGDRNGMYFLHGALHFFINERGEVRKYCWSRTGIKLTTLIRTGIEKKQFPLFVAEGTAEKKLEQIRRNAYLAYCYEKLGRVKNTLVVFGLAFGDSDAHIRKAIAENREFKTLCVSLYGDPQSEQNLGIAAALAGMNTHRAKLGYVALDIRYFSSTEAAPWGNPPAKVANPFAGLGKAKVLP